MLNDMMLCEELFHTPTGVAFADFITEGRRETWPIRSKRFRTWMQHCSYQATGGAASAAEIRSALEDRDFRLADHQFQWLAAQQSRRQPPSCAERKNASGHSCQRPSSFVMWNTPVEVQLPQPGVSIIRAAPHRPVETALAFGQRLLRSDLPDRGPVGHHRRRKVGGDHHPCGSLALRRDRRAPSLVRGRAAKARIEAVRIVDMSGSNAWTEAAGIFARTRAAYLEHEQAKTELKSLLPEDAKEAIGHGIRAKRSKSGAVSFDLLVQEGGHAAVESNPSPAWRLRWPRRRQS